MIIDKIAVFIVLVYKMAFDRMTFDKIAVFDTIIVK
jgi:hypothetical protein